MRAVTPFPNIGAAREEAAAWIARAHRGLTSAETTALQDWSQRPANRRAMDELSEVWQGLDSLSALSHLFPRRDAPAPAPSAARRGGRWRVGLAAALVVAAGAATYRFAFDDGADGAARIAADANAALQAQAYSSTIGEHRSIRLQDGSTLALNSDTLVEVAFTPGLRSVELHRGEAHFEVAHDAARPFLVAVNSKTLRAVGTAFNVRRRTDEALDVVVTEGIVSAYAGGTARQLPAADRTDAQRLEAGQMLRVRPDGSEEVTRLDALQIDSLTAWQRGVLVLDGASLEEAMAEVSRYTARRIVVDPQLRSIRLGGSFRTADLDEMFAALRASFGIEAIEAADGTLRLTKPATSGAPPSDD